MADPGYAPGPSAIERVRSVATPVVCALAAGLGLLCTLGVVSILTQLLSLELVSDRFIGWLGLSALAALGASAVALQAGRVVGSRTALALGGGGGGGGRQAGP